MTLLLPYNIASYALLTHMYAQVVNMIPGDLIVSMGDTHIYLNHIGGLEEQLRRIPNKLPHLNINHKGDIDNYKLEDFALVDYTPHPTIKFDIAV